jgi:hypothetical protein
LYGFVFAKSQLCDNEFEVAFDATDERSIRWMPAFVESISLIADDTRQNFGKVRTVNS